MTIGTLGIFAPCQVASVGALAGAIETGALGEQATVGLAHLDALLAEEGERVEEFSGLVQARLLARLSDRDRYLLPIAVSIRQNSGPFGRILPRLSLFGDLKRANREWVAGRNTAPPPPQQPSVQLMSDGSPAPEGKRRSGGMRAESIIADGFAEPPLAVSPMRVNNEIYSPLSVEAAITIILRLSQPVFEALKPRGTLGFFLLGPKKERTIRFELENNGVQIEISAKRCRVDRVTKSVSETDQPASLLIDVKLPLEVRNPGLREELRAADAQYGPFGITEAGWGEVSNFKPRLRPDNSESYEEMLRRFLETFQVMFTYKPSQPVLWDVVH